MAEKLFYAWTEILNDLLLHTYLKKLQAVTDHPSGKSWLMKNLKRRSDLVEGSHANVLFTPPAPWGWRPVHPGTGVFPSNGTQTVAEQSYRLAMYGAGIQVNIEEMVNLDLNNPRAVLRLMDSKVNPIIDGFPDFQQLIVRTPQSGIVLVASGAESSLSVAVDNAGLANTLTGERLKWIGAGMYLQWYRGVRTKVGEPVRVTYADHENNTVYLAESRGVADNDFAVPTTVDGDEDLYWVDSDTTPDQQEMSPGIYDVLDNDNTFQGMDRSLAANFWARAVVKDMSGAVPTKATLRKFFRDTDASSAATSASVLDYLYDQLFATNTRYVDTRELKYGYQSIKFDQTDILAVPDGLSNSIDVVDFEKICIAQKGGAIDPFGKGWYEIPRTTKQCRDWNWWGRLVAIGDLRNCGRYHGFIITNTIG